MLKIFDTGSECARYFCCLTFLSQCQLWLQLLPGQCWDAKTIICCVLVFEVPQACLSDFISVIKLIILRFLKPHPAVGLCFSVCSGCFWVDFDVSSLTPQTFTNIFLWRNWFVVLSMCHQTVILTAVLHREIWFPKGSWHLLTGWCAV